MQAPAGEQVDREAILPPLPASPPLPEGPPLPRERPSPQPELQAPPPLPSDPEAAIVVRVTAEHAGPRAADLRGARGRAGLEMMIGTHLMAWIGAIVFLFGVAYFVKYAIDNAWIGPMGRVIGGALLGTSFVVAAHFERVRRAGGFSQILAGSGLAVYYVCIFFAFGQYELVGQSFAFGAASLTTLLGIVIAVRNQWPSTCMLALIGGFVSPALLSTGEPRPHVLFPYLAILILLAMGCASFRRWRGINQFALIATLLHGLGWYLRYYDEAFLFPACGYLGLFYLMFLCIPLMHGMVQRVSGNVESVMLLSSNAFAALGGFYVLLKEEHRAALVLVILLQALLVFLAQLFGRIRLPEDRRTRICLMLQGLVLLLIAVPVQFKFYTVPITWALQGAVLAFLAYRYGSRICAGFSAAALLLATGGLLYHLPLHTAAFTPVLNRPFVSWLAVVLASVISAKLWQHRDAEGRRTGLPWLGWMLAVMLACTVCHLEVASFWELRPMDPLFRRAYRAESLIALWGLLAVVLALLGWLLRQPMVRWLSLAALACGLVLLRDYRILSPTDRLLLHSRFLCVLWYSIAGGLVAWLTARVEPGDSESLLLVRRRLGWGVGIAALLIAAVNMHGDLVAFWNTRAAHVTSDLASYRSQSLLALWALLPLLLGLAGRKRQPLAWLGFFFFCFGCGLFVQSLFLHVAGPSRLVLNTAFGARMLLVATAFGSALLFRRSMVLPARAVAGLAAAGGTMLVANLHSEIWWFWESRISIVPAAEIHQKSSLVGLWAGCVLLVGYLTWVSRRIPFAMPVKLAVALGSVVFAVSLFDYQDTPDRFLLHWAFLARLVFLSVLWVLAVWERGEHAASLEVEGAVMHPTLEVLANVGLSVLIAVELMAWSSVTRVELPFFGPVHEAFGQGCISALWSIQALALIVLGLFRDLKHRRVLGFVLFAIVVAKIFVFDTSHLERVHRILSFGATGLLLMAGSYLYHGVGRRLREHGKG